MTRITTHAHPCPTCGVREVCGASCEYKLDGHDLPTGATYECWGCERKAAQRPADATRRQLAAMTADRDRMRRDILRLRDGVEENHSGSELAQLIVQDLERIASEGGGS